MSAPTAPDPTAAGSGRSATERFTQKGLRTDIADPARVSAIATDAITALHEVIRKHRVTYAEYDALKAWLISVGEDGEWPLFLDVWVEHVVEEVCNADRKGAVGTIEGPYYIAGSPEGHGETTLPMRDDLLTEPLRISAGELTVPPGAGLGIEIDPDKLAHYRQDR